MMHPFYIPNNLSFSFIKTIWRESEPQVMCLSGAWSFSFPQIYEQLKSKKNFDNIKVERATK